MSRTDSAPAAGALRRLAVVDALLLIVALAAVAALSRPDAATPFTVTSQASSAATGTAGEAADHSFMYTSGGSPVAWSACDPVHYRVNASGAPRDGGFRVAEALRRITAATGLRFVRDGRTDVLPGDGFSGWGSTDPVVAWSTASARPQLAGSVVGEGGVQVVPRAGGGWRIGKGYALLDATDLARYPAGWGLSASGSVYAHELGHAVGLGHAQTPPEVMVGRLSRSSTSTYQRGDLAGLAALAPAGRCG